MEDVKGFFKEEQNMMFLSFQQMLNLFDPKDFDNVINIYNLIEQEKLSPF